MELFLTCSRQLLLPKHLVCYILDKAIPKAFAAVNSAWQNSGVICPYLNAPTTTKIKLTLQKSVLRSFRCDSDEQVIRQMRLLQSKSPRK